MSEDRLCNRLLIGVSGSIHAVHIHSYLLRFRESFAREIQVIMTRSAADMVPPRTIALYTDGHVLVDLWDNSATANRAAHIQLPRWADLFLILPASANILGKAANGIADDLLSTAVLASPKPVAFAPAMNPAMWQSSAVQRNLLALKQDGHYVIPPDNTISVTSGEWDQGLGPTPDVVLAHLQHIRMKGLRDDYWDEATSNKPLTPAQRKLHDLAAAAERRKAAGQQKMDPVSAGEVG